ncbi:SCO family protein [Chloroflexia bacterium SDU3-3]|nr:SCO family protein [Chloroflexia bacterium SDU3-3]
MCKQASLWRIWAALLAALLLAACQGGAASADEIATPEITGGSAVNPPRALHDFTLTSMDGSDMRLSDLRGKPILLFFGYTHCPDVCPTTLVDLRDTKRLLGADGDKVRYLFISVDGERDSPALLKHYVQSFDPSFIGMTGDEATLRKIGADYGLYFQQQDVKGTSAGYLVDHSAVTYLIDAEGSLRMLFPFGTPAEVFANELRALLK